MDALEIISVLAVLVSTSIATYSACIARRALKSNTSQHDVQFRPYVVLESEGNSSGRTGTRFLAKIKNYGTVPAEDITVDFDPELLDNGTSLPSKSFLPPGGVAKWTLSSPENADLDPRKVFRVTVGYNFPSHLDKDRQRYCDKMQQFLF